MKSINCILLFSLFLLSCETKSGKEVEQQLPVKEPTKLEQLFLLPSDSVMDFYDLSNDSIKIFPDLSAYSIKSLDLSHNLLDTIKPNFLPQKLEKLNLSHNQYAGCVRIRKDAIPSLKELDISYNALTKINIALPLYRILLSHNDFTYINFNHKHIQYLDVSCNSNLSEKVNFEPALIDTVIHYGVAGGKRLLGPIHTSYNWDFRNGRK